MTFTADLISISGTAHYDSGVHTLTWLTGDNFAAMLAAQSVTINGHSCTVTGVTSATVLAVTDGSDSTGDYSWAASVKGCQSVLLGNVGLYHGQGSGPTCGCIHSIILSGIPSAQAILAVGQSYVLNFAYADTSKDHTTITATTGPPLVWLAPQGNKTCTVSAVGPTNVTLDIPSTQILNGVVKERNFDSIWQYTNVNTDYGSHQANYNNIPPASKNGGANVNCQYLMSAYGPSGYFKDGHLDIFVNSGASKYETGSILDVINDGTYYTFNYDSGGCGSFDLPNPYFSDFSTFDTVANAGAGPTITMQNNLRRLFIGSHPVYIGSHPVYMGV